MNNKNSNDITIADINKDYTLSIIATLDSKTIEMPVEYARLTVEEVAEVDKRFGQDIVPLENIMTKIQEKMLEVSFKGHVSTLDLVAVSEEGVFKWAHAKVYRVKLASGKEINLITSKQRFGEKFNRRRGVRIDLDKAMKLEQQGQTYTVVVRDLSYCGVSFVEPNGAQVQKGMPFTLHLSENSDDGEKLIGAFTGKILNQRTLDSGAVVSGCILSASHASFLQRYIAAKQMEQISGKRKKAAGIKKTVTGEDWQRKLADALEASLDEVESKRLNR